MRKSALTVLAPLGLVVALAGCETLGNPIAAMRAKKEGPDEFQVLARKPLRLPGETRPQALPLPRPGAPSPLDRDPQADAIAALIGTPEGTAPAPTQRPPSAAQVSRGEAALLAAAGAPGQGSQIRTQIATENATRAANAPFEPPTIFEVLSSDEFVDPATVIDPEAEAERLREQGTLAPTRPRRAPQIEEDDGLIF
ncbi:MAG: DUF3035 domain-containing protein [Pseudomonadota bacterium]